VNQSQNRLLRDVKLCSSHFPPIENKSQYQSCGKILAASFSMLKLVNQCVIYISNGGILKKLDGSLTTVESIESLLTWKRSHHVIEPIEEE
jgi:hypothetical protein